MYIGLRQCSRIGTCGILRFFRFQKKHEFLRFFEVTFQKVIKGIKFVECV